jgi:HrpA-like RNA helicase
MLTYAGVLLRMLEEDAELSNYTHVLVDEVHDVLLTYADVLLTYADVC